MKKILIIASVALVAMSTLCACGKKSEANKEQIESARQEADEMTKGFDVNKSMKPGSDAAAKETQGKVVMDTETTTEIIVSEEPASK